MGAKYYKIQYLESIFYKTGANHYKIQCLEPIFYETSANYRFYKIQRIFRASF
jgi:hypothetical protein